MIGHRAHAISASTEGEVESYQHWQWEIPGPQKGEGVFLTGVGGILYPPGSLHADLADSTTFMDLCPTADDVWFYFMARRAGYVHSKTKGLGLIHTWRNTQDGSLAQENVEKDGNDRAFEGLVRKYGNPLTH